uniref:Retrotransposon gag domain-containing protein n=1 Tax=Chromera velia CCMP2878 TaxID=1169474 RepID=A0A0G4FH62_9ALVE|eukprot:Cvel_16953.t1-p1 / transcript=Cvel_16953.t1 / gene=Cvel_16953 / organism=Chromera_velia_CCMP2878 / gene_product=Protein transport protein Sec61 subunit beta, putative / transcript_product=Protein transport protein Sec61 subunit beta, putative / location=Cvel_scaffold1330:6559-11308(-) / protein_length=295 / sequence_SO=supercontig / SO=protein_coding / is_pseudo=false
MAKGSMSQSHTNAGAAAGAGAGKAQAAATVGGQRTTLAKRGGTKSSQLSTSVGKSRGGAPQQQQQQGILRFYQDDAPGLKIGPTTVLVLSLVYMAIVVILHIMGKVKQSMAGPSEIEGFTREFEELKALYQAQAAEIAELRAILDHLHSTSSSAFAKVIKPTYDYGGTVEEFEDWIWVCKKYHNFHSMTDAQLLSAANSHLKGDAVKAVKLAEKNRHTPATWLELQTVLLTYFQDRRTHDDQRDELDRMKCAGVSGTDLKTYTSNFISKMLFIPDMSMSLSDKAYQYEKGLPEDV